MDKTEKLARLLSDEKLAKELLSIEEPEKVKEFLAKHDIEMDLDEIKGLAIGFKLAAENKLTEEDCKMAADGELSEHLLELVSGGKSTYGLGTALGGGGGVFAGVMTVAALSNPITGVTVIAGAAVMLGGLLIGMSIDAWHW